MKKFHTPPWALCLFLILLFLFFLVFFYQIHPIVLLDSDDWTYISYSRAALPTTKFFNPCRIFPEIFMSLCGSIAAYVIYPLTGQYMRAQSFVMALAYSSFITWYIAEVIRFLQRKFRTGLTGLLSTAVIFVIFHFMVFRTENSGNTYLFWSKDATCFFYYNIPILMNCILSMRILSEDVPGLRTESGSFRKALFILLVYFSILSNLYASIITAGAVASFLLVRLCRTVKKHDRFSAFLKGNAVPLLIEFFWLVSALLELSGDRAEAAYSGNSALKNTIFNLGPAFSFFKESVLSMNRIMLAFIAFVLILSGVIYASRKGLRLFLKDLIPLFLSFAVISFLLVVLSAASVPSYAGLSTNLLAPFFFIFLAAVCCMSAVLQTCRPAASVMPLLAVILFSLTNTSMNTFIECNDSQISAETCIEIGEYLVSQYKEAAAAGLDSFELHVLDCGGGDNWPHASYLPERLTNTMLKHGIIGRRMDVTLCADHSVNEEFNITCWD